MRICSGAGCLRTVPDAVRFCSECGGPTTPNVGRVHRPANQAKYTLAHLYAGTHWKNRIRLAVLRRDPVCKRCDKEFSRVADHIVPAEVAVLQAQASGRYPLNPWAGFYLLSNLQGLCDPCHHIKTAEDKAHQGNWPSVLDREDAQPKKKWSF